MSQYRLISLIAIISILLAFTACSSGESTTESTLSNSPPQSDQVQNQPAGASSFFSINEIGLDPNGFVALTNLTEVPVSLEGLALCQGSGCVDLPTETVAPGATVRVAKGSGTGLENVVGTKLELGSLDPNNGEIALYLNGTNGDPEWLLIYLEWGATPHDLTDEAIQAGLWIEGSYAPTSANATRLFRVEESGLWLFEE